MPEPIKRRRIHELDLLRGFFIFVIIIDHLQFWPSPLRYLTGEGRLWVSAAEGFFLISGLLIGYIRAYKGRNTSLREISIKTLKRAGMLYVWGIAVTLIVTGYTLLIGGNPMLPILPNESQLSSLPNFLLAVLSTNFFNDWIYFLRLYAIVLAITPLFLWMIRRGYIRVTIVLILATYLVSFAYPDAVLQWQLLFFGAALIGYKLESIIDFMNRHRTFKKYFIITNLFTMFSTMVISFFFVHGWWLVENNIIMSYETYINIRIWLDPIFSNDPMMPARMLLAFIWFSGGLALVHVLRNPLLKYLGWLLMPFGERSLTVYCLQAFVLAIIVVIIPVSPYPIVNLLISLGTIMVCWLLLSTRFIQKVLPR